MLEGFEQKELREVAWRWQSVPSTHLVSCIFIYLLSSPLHSSHTEHRISYIPNGTTLTSSTAIHTVTNTVRVIMSQQNSSQNGAGGEDQPPPAENSSSPPPMSPRNLRRLASNGTSPPQNNSGLGFSSSGARPRPAILSPHPTSPPPAFGLPPDPPLRTGINPVTRRPATNPDNENGDTNGYESTAGEEARRADQAQGASRTRSGTPDHMTPAQQKQAVALNHMIE